MSYGCILWVFWRKWPFYNETALHNVWTRARLNIKANEPLNWRVGFFIQGHWWCILKGYWYSCILFSEHHEIVHIQIGWILYTYLVYPGKSPYICSSIHHLLSFQIYMLNSVMSWYYCWYFMLCCICTQQPIVSNFWWSVLASYLGKCDTGNHFENILFCI